MAYDCIPKALSRLFYVFGTYVAKHPLPFLLLPLFIAIDLGIGVLWLDPATDTEYLYVPTNAPSRDERARIQELFFEDDSKYFSSYRQAKIGGFLQIHIRNSDGGSILNQNSFDAVFRLNDFVLNKTAEDKDGATIAFADVCSKFNGTCNSNSIIEIMTGKLIDDVTLNYPVHYDDGSFHNIIQQVGGLKLNSAGQIESARSILLTYFVRFQTDADVDTSTLWMDALRDEMFEYKDFGISIVFQTSLTLEQEVEEALGSVLPLFVITYGVLLVFALVTTMMFDWVRSKPWIGLSGLVASILGVASSVGLLSFCGVQFASVVGTMPFLILGIGLDNMYIMVSAWRATSVNLPTEERVARTMQDISVSITITTVTDAVAFGVGCLTPFRSVTIFCAFTGVAIVFVYFYTITFTAACLTYSGRREAANRHAFTCTTVKTRAQAEEDDESRAYRLCFASGGIPENKNTTLKKDANKGQTDEEEQELIILPYLNKFLGSTYANFIMRLPVKACIIVLYCAIIGGAIYGVTVMEEGLDRANLAPDGSYYSDFATQYDKDFAQLYGPVMMVTFDQALDYESEAVRTKIDDIIQDFRQNEYFVSSEAFTISWLNDYINYLETEYTNKTEFTKAEFISILQNEFLPMPSFQVYELDVAFNDDNSEIVASRMYMQTEDVQTSVTQTSLMIDAREIAEDARYDVMAFTPRFIFWDNYTVILMTTIQNLGIAILSIFVVSLFLIPSITTVVWVTLATVSICTCIIGYMALWDVPMDTISAVDLVMSIGFSVDFAAHISYHFVASGSDDSNENARQALGHLGTPIIQGASSTVLAVLVLATSTSYIFRTFFKLIVLVISFGFFHAMFLLPVLLSTFKFDCCCKKAKKNEVKWTENSPGIDNNAFSANGMY